MTSLRRIATLLESFEPATHVEPEPVEPPKPDTPEAEAEAPPIFLSLD